MSLTITSVPRHEADHNIPLLTCTHLPDTSSGAMYVIRVSDSGARGTRRHIYTGDRVENALAGWSLAAHLGEKIELFELDFPTIAAISTVQHRISVCQDILLEDMYDTYTEDTLEEYYASRERLLADAGF